MTVASEGNPELEVEDVDTEVIMPFSGSNVTVALGCSEVPSKRRTECMIVGPILDAGCEVNDRMLNLIELFFSKKFQPRCGIMNDGWCTV
jgi:hypothetical protein